MSQTAQLQMFGLPPEAVACPADGGPVMEERLRKLQKMSIVQVAPNVWRHTGNGTEPEMVICRVVPKEDGTLHLVPAYEQWMRLNSKTVKLLGMEGQWHTLMRLGRAGFIEILRPAPNFHMLNLTTWWGHLARVAEDPEYWDRNTPDGRKRFKTYKEHMF